MKIYDFLAPGGKGGVDPATPDFDPTTQKWPRDGTAYTPKNRPKIRSKMTLSKPNGSNFDFFFWPIYTPNA